MQRRVLGASCCAWFCYRQQYDPGRFFLVVVLHDVLSCCKPNPRLCGAHRLTCSLALFVSQAVIATGGCDGVVKVWNLPENGDAFIDTDFEMVYKVCNPNSKTTRNRFHLLWPNVKWEIQMSCNT